jgi:hypothetical protein
MAEMAQVSIAPKPKYKLLERRSKIKGLATELVFQSS